MVCKMTKNIQLYIIANGQLTQTYHYFKKVMHIHFENNNYRIFSKQYLKRKE